MTSSELRGMFAVMRSSTMRAGMLHACQRICRAVCLLAAIGLAVLHAHSRERQPPVGSGEGVRVLVKFKPAIPLPDRKALHIRLGGTFLKTIRGTDALDVVVFPRTRESKAVIREYLRNILVEYAEPDGVVRAAPSGAVRGM